MYECHHPASDGPSGTPLTLSLCSLRRHCVIGTGIPIINLRRSSDRLRFIMGIPLPVNNGPGDSTIKCPSCRCRHVYEISVTHTLLLGFCIGWLGKYTLCQILANSIIFDFLNFRTICDKRLLEKVEYKRLSCSHWWLHFLIILCFDSPYLEMTNHSKCIHMYLKLTDDRQLTCGVFLNNSVPWRHSSAKQVDYYGLKAFHLYSTFHCYPGSVLH